MADDAALSPLSLAAPVKTKEPQLSGWGRVMRPAREVRSEDLEALTRDAVLCRGLGRSYGDSSVPPPGRPVAAGTVLADRLLSFDESTGLLRAEAGFSLKELVRLFLPRGFFPPVTPGTQFVTLGGMVAADVHGKNHHRDGCFGAHVRRLRIRVADGRILECGPDLEPDLFRATVGGMGLTGHILEVELRMFRVPSQWIAMESERIHDIDAFIDGLKESGTRWPMTYGWIDCLSPGRTMGRGILMRGRWAEPGEAPPQPPRHPLRIPVPFVLPGFVVNRWSVWLFNAVLYWSHVPRVKRALQSPDAFFYPLDRITDWNRMYGPRGFTQYQCVLPHTGQRGQARRFLEVLTRRGGASFLCVIKDCGPEGAGLLSFPRPGISIALDIPLTDGTQALVDALNEVVIAEGGRVYLAKDLLTRPEHFRAMEPRLEEWMRVRRRYDPGLRVRSAQSVRMFGDPA
jgi:decaprenylphospho-beta-D-ribofuranose 2-oxidase